MKLTKYIFVAVLFALFATSCFRENLDSFGTYNVYMSKDTAYIELKDTLINKAGSIVANDSAVKVLGISRSGISPDYPELTVHLKVDSVYMDSMKTIYNDAAIPTSAKSSAVLYFKNTRILPENCYSLQRTVIIPKDKMTTSIGLRLHLDQIAALNRSEWYILPLSITNTSSNTILQTKKRVMLRINPKFTYKSIAL
jgi:hypothetical protein